MPQIAQQEYKVIAPKPGRTFVEDAAALGELKKAVLNGIGFDCLLKNLRPGEGTLDRVLGVYENGVEAYVWDSANAEYATIALSYTVTQYQGLAAVQEAEDELMGFPVQSLPVLTDNGFLYEDEEGVYICVNGYALSFTTDDNDHLASLEISTTKKTVGFVNISWEDALKLIGISVH